MQTSIFWCMQRKFTTFITTVLWETRSLSQCYPYSGAIFIQWKLIHSVRNHSLWSPVEIIKLVQCKYSWEGSCINVKISIVWLHIIKLYLKQNLWYVSERSYNINKQFIHTAFYFKEKIRYVYFFVIALDILDLLLHARL